MGEESSGSFLFRLGMGPLFGFSSLESSKMCWRLAHLGVDMGFGKGPRIERILVGKLEGIYVEV